LLERNNYQREVMNEQLERSWEAILVSSQNLENMSAMFTITSREAEKRLNDVNTLHRIIEGMSGEFHKKDQEIDSLNQTLTSSMNELDKAKQEKEYILNNKIVRILRKIHLI
jgi:hypothetical protein